jgi:hypothetical protein
MHYFFPLSLLLASFYFFSVLYLFVALCVCFAALVWELIDGTGHLSRTIIGRQ